LSDDTKDSATLRVQPNNGPLPDTEYDLIRWHGHAALFTVLISTLFGLAVATKFSFPTFMGGHAWETWGRLRYNHTQGIFFGWLGNAFIAFCYYVTPRLTNHAVTSRKLGWAIFWIWNFMVVLPGWVLVCMGFSQPLEWAEFPIIVDAFVILALVLMLVQFVRPYFRVPASELYVTGWYIVGGLVFTTFAYPIGNLVPQLVAGAKGAAFSGLWIHDAIGLFVTPLAVGMAYYVIPAVTRRPIYSHFLSMLGFWLLFFIYPLNGTHHYVYSAIPMSAQRGAIIASVYLGFDVILVVSNLLLSLRGSSSKVAGNVALRFIWFGTVAYLVVSLQGSIQALMPVNRFIHFSDWVIGHSHLAMIGFASFTAAGALAHIWSRIPGVRYSERAMNWAFWLLAVGLVLMVVDLTSAGLVEGQMWVSRAPWIDSVRAAYPFWLMRIFSGLPIIAGFILFWAGLVTGPRNGDRTVTLASLREARDEEDEPAAVRFAERIPSFLSYAFVVAFVAGFGFFVLSFVVLGLVPAMRLQAEINRTAPRSMQPLTAGEEHGREIYGREGCAYCHTEQVRTITADVQRFGAPTAAWETQYDYPQLWGTRRIGPDLSREYGLRTDDWQLTHLFNPRSTVPDSIMPGYSWMFDGSAARPTNDALDLVAYIHSLGRERALAGDSNQAQVDRGSAMEMSSSYGSQGVPDTFPRMNTLGLDDSAPLLARASSSDPIRVARGAAIYQHNCSGCHGPNADGQGIAAAGLMPQPINLRMERFSGAHLSTVLWDGVYGSSMPAWRQLERNDLEDVTAYIETLQSPQQAVSMSPSDLNAAQQIYSAHCVSCHGADGSGDGPAAGGVQPSPVNFHVMQPNSQRALTVITSGIPGSAMPAWKDVLKPDEIKLLISYVEQMYVDDKEAARP
jgi:cbb3-type cytochrome c oxidase subunit I/cbb3-type cytochrome c oxidase subunit II